MREHLRPAIIAVFAHTFSGVSIARALPIAGHLTTRNSECFLDREKEKENALRPKLLKLLSPPLLAAIHRASTGSPLEKRRKGLIAFEVLPKILLLLILEQSEKRVKNPRNKEKNFEGIFVLSALLKSSFALSAFSSEGRAMRAAGPKILVQAPEKGNT